MRHPVRGTTGAALPALLLALLASGSYADPVDPGRESTKEPESSRHAMEGMAKLTLDDKDETATLHAVLIGLTEIPDGATFVWRRAHGRLSGTVRPLFSFKNADGAVCRQLKLTLTSGTYTRTVEGAACRDPDGRWALAG